MISAGYNIVFLFILLIFTPTVKDMLIRLEQILYPLVDYIALNVDIIFFTICLFGLFLCSVYSLFLYWAYRCRSFRPHAST